MGLAPIGRRRRTEWIGGPLERARNRDSIDGECVVGHVTGVPRAAIRSALLVFVDPEYHDRGIGTKRCRKALAYAAADRLERVARPCPVLGQDRCVPQGSSTGTPPTAPGTVTPTGRRVTCRGRPWQSVRDRAIIPNTIV
jgi:GNAT superfamily N-acetyltransferase